MTELLHRVLIISNPASGRRRRAHWCERVVLALREAGVDVDIYETAQSGDARRYAAEAISGAGASTRGDAVTGHGRHRLQTGATLDHRLEAGATLETGATLDHRLEAGATPDRYDGIVACGGDGTIQEVASALADHRAAGAASGAGTAAPALGVIPSGRCNDLAHVLGVHANVESTIDALLRGRRMPLDLGRVNGRYFCTVATMGFDAAVSRYVDGLRVPLLTGTRAYLFGAARMVLTFRAPELGLEGDFGRIEGRFVLATTANTATYGGSMPIAPMAVPTDGMLDLCLIDDAPRHKLVPLLARAVRGRHVGRPGVRFLRTRRFRIDSADPRELWADGEWIAHTPAEIEVAPAAVEVMVPP